MKKLILILCILLIACINMNVFADGVIANNQIVVANPLVNINHNCPNTAVMLPASFNQNIDHYIFTVANWVREVLILPVLNDHNAFVKINGIVYNGNDEDVTIKMDDNPQEMIMEVFGANKFYKKYTFFMQRRPSSKRTRVSSGYIQEIYQKKGKTHIKADLVKVTYNPNTNISSFENETNVIYDYVCDPNCIFYYGNMNNPIRATDANQFMSVYANPSNLYRLIYIEDKIVAVMPYQAD